MSPRRAFALVATFLVAGCATLNAPFDQHLGSEAPQVRECADWYRDLDEQVDMAGVRDAQDARIAGFPYLRVSRLLADLLPRAAANEPALQALADRMLALDLAARRYEIMNLPSGPVLRPAEALQRTQHCGRLLRELDMAKPEARQLLLQRAQVPDDYRLGYRFFGLYALTRFAIAEGVKRYEAQMQEAFQRELSSAGRVRHAPPPIQPLPRERVAAVLKRASGNPLGIPEPGEAELAELLAAYAPSFDIEMKGDFDRFGALRWPRHGKTPEVDGAQLVVYAQPAWTRYRNLVLLQLVYTIWFPERPPASPGDILAGKLDGITWRVTLAPDGEPLVYDTIHPCGCYHQFFPTPRAQARAAPDQLEEWLFAPQALPRIAEGERPLLRIASGTHYIERVGVVRGSDSLARYELRPYDELRSLVRLGEPGASAFGPDGLVAGTERPERFIFWPTGIVSAGAMRQWGRHATAFVGRRHFDDADLFDKRFRFELE